MIRCLGIEPKLSATHLMKNCRNNKYFYSCCLTLFRFYSSDSSSSTSGAAAGSAGATKANVKIGLSFL